MIELITFGGQTIAVDVVGDFSPEYTAELTDHVVEDGSNVNDHKIFKPVLLGLEVNQTEHPIDAPGYNVESVSIEIEPNRAVILSPFLLVGNAIRGALGGLGSAGNSYVGYRSSSPEDRGNKLFEDLLTLYTSDEVATVTYKGRVYPNMSLVGIKKIESAAHVGLSKFQLSFKELRTVRLAAAGAGVLPDPESLRAKPPKKQGIKSPHQVEEAARPKSLLAAGLDALG